MSDYIVLVENTADWLPQYPRVTVVSAKEYLAQAELKHQDHKIINLCRSYRYLSTGYYCSLLGEARRHKIIPSVRTITDLSSKASYSLNIEDLDQLVHTSVAKTAPPGTLDTFTLLIAFGECDIRELQELARQLFDLFRCPLLKVEFRHKGRWYIASIKPGSISALEGPQQAFFAKAVNGYLEKRWQAPRARSLALYDLAVLHNPAEQLPPSNKRALQKFIKVGKKLDIDVELIERKDYGQLAEYDALFIRETTRIDHHTYRFAKKAEAEGMVVIDDPDSIVKCTNKVYLAELLTLHKIATPRTVILQKGPTPLAAIDFPYPVVFKIPDGSFSRGVYKVETVEQARELCEKLFKESDLILAQEFVYTEFDWRIGVLNRQPIYACQYFMSKRHWQVVKHAQNGEFVEGSAKTLPISEAPPDVVRTAVNAANLIGDGLYGVDVKQNDRGVFVIEVNDNPNIDAGIEDEVLGDDLYYQILREFIRRIELRRQR
jgi:glutathione synthase/RimK-type ligase-like ATP-grasp enzyme